MTKKTNKTVVEVDSRKMSIFLISVSVILVLLLFYPYLKPRSTRWCNFENNITDSDVPRNECVHMSILSKDMRKIDFDKFTSLDISDVGCYDSYDELPPCAGDEYYFTQYELSLLSDIEVDGTVCIGYHITFYESDDVLYDGYKDIYMMQNFKSPVSSSSELKQILINCEVR